MGLTHEDKITAIQREIAIVKNDMHRLHEIMLAKLAQKEIGLVKNHFHKHRQKEKPAHHDRHGSTLYRLGLTLSIGYLMAALFREIR